jgi:hypothetical protein
MKFIKKVRCLSSVGSLGVHIYTTIVVYGFVLRGVAHVCTYVRAYTSGLPDGLFSYINPNLGKIWRDLDWKMLYFMTIWNIFGIIYSRLV